MSEKHSERVRTNDNPKDHLSYLHGRLADDYKQKHKVEYDAMTIGAKNREFEFTFGEPVNGQKIDSFAKGICEAMFEVRDYSGLKREQREFVDHLVYMMAEHFGLNMNRMERREKFIFNFSGPVARVTMLDKDGNKIIDNQPIAADAVKVTMDRLGEERLHAEARIKVLRDKNPARKALIDMATDWDGLVDTLQAFDENISLEHRKDMLQGLDVFSEDTDALLRADTDTINGINKFLRAYFMIEKGLSGSDLTTAMEKHRVNQDGTGYVGSKEQNVAWVRFIRHDLFEYEIPTLTEAQIKAAESGENAFKEIDSTPDAGASVEEPEPEELEVAEPPEPEELADELVELARVGKTLSLPEEVKAMSLEEQISYLSLVVDMFSHEMTKQYDEFARDFQHNVSEYEGAYDEFIDAVETDSEVISSRDSVQAAGDRLYGKIVDFREEARKDFVGIRNVEVSVGFNLLGSFLASEYNRLEGEVMGNKNVQAGLNQVRTDIIAAGKKYDQYQKALNDDSLFPLPDEWDLPTEADLREIAPDPGDTPEDLDTVGLNVHMEQDELDTKQSRLLVDIQRKLTSKQESLRIALDDPGLTLSLGFSKEGSELGDLPYVTLSVDLPKYETKLPLITRSGDRKLARKMLRKSDNLNDQRAVERYLSVYRFHEDLDDIFAEIDTGIKGLDQARLEESIGDPDEKARELLDVELRAVQDELKERLGDNADKVESVVAVSNLLDRGKKNWKGQLNFKITFAPGVEPHELNLVEKFRESYDEGQEWLPPLYRGEMVDMIIGDVEAVIAGEKEPDVQPEPEVTRVTASSERFEKYRSKPVIAGKMPKYMETEPGSREPANDKERENIAELDRLFEELMKHVGGGEWSAANRDFLALENGTDINMSAVWATAAPDRLMQFYAFAGMAADKLGDGREAYRRYTIAKKIKPDHPQLIEDVDKMETQYVDVSFRAEAIRADVAPFDGNMMIEAANTALEEKGKFSGVLPKLDDGHYYIVTVDGVERRMYLNE